MSGDTRGFAAFSIGTTLYPIAEYERVRGRFGPAVRCREGTRAPAVRSRSPPLLLQCKELPVALDPFEFVASAVLEGESGSEEEVPDGAGDEHLTR